MGGEIAQEREWNHERALDWFQLNQERYRGIQNLVRDLNLLYRDTPALHRGDCERDGFQWVRANAEHESYYVYLRFGTSGDSPILVLCNLTPVPRDNYLLGVPRAGRWRQILNTDHGNYGGSDYPLPVEIEATDNPCDDQPCSISLSMPPLATVVLEHRGE